MKVLKKILRFIPFILVLLIGFWSGTSIGESIASSNWPPLLMIVSQLLMAALAIIIGVIIHEAGHLVFGLLTGYRFSSFRIFSWMWYSDGSTIKLTRYDVPGTGGQCLMIPVKKNGDYPYFWYLVGGGIANLLLAAGLFDWSTIVSPDFASHLTIAAFVNVSLGIVNLLPIYSPITNDGANILFISKSEAARKAFALQLIAAEAQIHGKRLSELDDNLFIEPSDEDFDNEILTTSYNYLITRELDRHHYDQVYTMIDSLLARDNLALNPISKQLLLVEKLFLDLMKGNTALVTKSYDKELQKLVSSMTKNHLFANRFLYAYEKLVNHDEEKADQHVKQFHDIALNYPYKGDLALEKELLQLAIEKN